MTPRKLIGVLIRMTALLMCLYGGYLLVASVYDAILTAIFLSIGQLSLSHFALRTLLPSGTYVAAGVFAIRYAERVVQFAYPHRHGFCDQCGYDLRGTPDRCPECGAVRMERKDNEK